MTLNYLLFYLVFNFFVLVKCNTTSQMPATQQDIQLILQSIEERLQILDKIERKVDNLNARVIRLENTFDSRIEKFSIETSEKYDHVYRKIEATSERNAHRLNTIETKFEKELKKLENKLNSNARSLDRIENSFVIPQEDSETKILMDAISESMQNTTSTNMEILKKVIILEHAINDQVLNTNITKREMQDNFRSIGTFQRKTSAFNQNLSHDINSIVKSLNGIVGLIHKKFTYINQKVDSNFNNTILAHNLFLESCHRIQLEEPQLESKITIVLETLLSLIANKTSNMYSDISHLHDLIRSHDSEIKIKVGVAKNTSLEMAQKSFVYKQEILNTVLDMQSKLNQWLVMTGNTISSNQTNNLEKLEAIEKKLQNVHQILNDNTNSHNVKPDTSQILRFMKENENIVKSKDDKMVQFFESIHEKLNRIMAKLNQTEESIKQDLQPDDKIKQDDQRTVNITQLRLEDELTKSKNTLDVNATESDIDTDFNYSSELIDGEHEEDTDVA